MSIQTKLALTFCFLIGALASGCQAKPASPKGNAVAASRTPPVRVADGKGQDPEPFVPQVRSGFKVEVWANVPGARSLAVSPDGKMVFVGTRQNRVNKVSVTETGQKVEVFQDGLKGSNGVCFLGPDLLIAELLQVKRYAANKGFAPRVQGEVILDGLPNETHHGWRYIKTGPDQRVWISIGAPCNVCERTDDPRFASICSFDANGKDFRVEAGGVRNSVGFDWDPDKKDMYFTDNGRDMLGDDIPPCELNRLDHGKTGLHFGFPFRWGDNELDPEFGKKSDRQDFQKPLARFQAHVAPLGCWFPRHQIHRSTLKNEILVAQHGSWNRSSPVGYQVVTVDLSSSDKQAKPFLWGFLGQEEEILGRPVDVAELPDGTLLVSDDHRGVIWAIKPAKQG